MKNINHLLTRLRCCYRILKADRYAIYTSKGNKFTTSGEFTEIDIKGVCAMVERMIDHVEYGDDLPACESVLNQAKEILK